MDRRGERILKLKDGGGSGDKIVFADIKAFKPSYWYVTFLCLTFYAAIFPFTNLSTDFFSTNGASPAVAQSAGGFLSQVFQNFLHMFSTAGGISPASSFSPR